jgi:hypothetical protein
VTATVGELHDRMHVEKSPMVLPVQDPLNVALGTDKLGQYTAQSNPMYATYSIN